MAGDGRALHVLAGPTASGKSAVAQYLAAKLGGAVLSADAMLVYRGMNIGTAKPDAAERGAVPYLGLDLADPQESFSVWRWRETVVAGLQQLPLAQTVVVAGGSGLYLRALTEGLAGAGPASGSTRWQVFFSEHGVEGLQATLRERAPAVLAALADPRNPRRLIRALERLEKFPAAEAGGGGAAARTWGPAPPIAGLWIEPATLHARIEQRVHAMYAAGLLEEVQLLLDSGRELSRTARQAIGYAEAAALLAGQCSREAAMERTVIRTRQLAKRQRTWLRHQARVFWVDAGDGGDIEQVAKQVQSVWREHGLAKLAE